MKQVYLTKLKNRDHLLVYNQLFGNFVLSIFPGFLIMALTEYINGSYGFVDGHGLILIGVFVTVFWMIRLHAYREAIRFEIKGKYADRKGHAVRFILRAIVAYAIGCFIHITGEGLNQTAFIMAGFCTVYIGGIFWLIFDSILSVDRGKAVTYVSKFYQGSRLDNLFAKINSPVIWFACKILVFLLTLWLYNKSFFWFSGALR